MVERMVKKEGREKIEGAVETENESLLRIKQLIMYAHLFSKKFRVENKPRQNSALNLCR